MLAGTIQYTREKNSEILFTIPQVILLSVSEQAKYLTAILIPESG
jgi:hypothetical protein